ncbi:MAG: HlyC/CorC family transporter [Loktanella sp.]|jgi:Mg2+/Co2+ transporter CorB|nr:HlyC/CorC family transporter [Loktanella sp.]MDO7607977.1 HlyC/CorC family transporter [Loktanella sp.]MDO7623514.1 HlyC/CorC family transporter [Loktanella sp.]MDO7626996.1 HlyC/CorC family transporter [Loktanella sp.]MDO7665613.1 HlyC/CorC family transporter [Loktanella sp.]
MDTTLFDGAFWMTAGAIFVLLVLSGFFSGSETALTAASRGKLRTAADKGSRGAQQALEVTEDNERLIGSVLLGNNVVNILATSLATALLTKIFGQNGVAFATLIMTLLVLIFAEVLPKTYAITNPEKVASSVARPIQFIVLVFSPIVSAVRVLVRGVLFLFGVRTDPDSHILAVREEIAGALHLGHSEGVVEKEDRDRILGALDLNERMVEEIMLHRSGIEMINIDQPPQDILAQCLQSQYSRIPLYKDDSENIVGVIHAKDLLRAMHKLLIGGKVDQKTLANFDILSVAMDAYFIPETTTLGDQMREFLRRKTHFALVVDEYGGLEGLITLEDILEEIVGEIADEFDQDETAQFEETTDGAFLVEGGMTIRDLNRAHDWNLPDDEANTIAGLVIHEAQMIPVEGQVFSFHGFRFEVVEKDENRIATLKVRPL